MYDIWYKPAVSVLSFTNLFPTTSNYNYNTSIHLPKSNIIRKEKELNRLYTSLALKKSKTDFHVVSISRKTSSLGLMSIIKKRLHILKG